MMAHAHLQLGSRMSDRCYARPAFRPHCSAASNATRNHKEYDVVVIGAGIIGLTVAHRFLRDTDLSVAVVEAAGRTCAGATGAGQGYIWNGHLDPEGAKWPFSRRSKQLWHEFAAEIRASGLDPLSTIGWKETGSLLFTSTGEQSLALHERLHRLAAAGLQVEYLDSMAAQKAEPALCLHAEGAAALVRGDTQLDANLTVQFIQEENRCLGARGRYQEYFKNPVTDFLWSPSENYMKGLQTPEGEIYSRRAVILAAGAWSAAPMQILSKRFNFPLVPPISPRKGHLLVLEKVPHVHLNYGVMEFDYIIQKAAVAQSMKNHENVESDPSQVGIAMTANMDLHGNILLGSSRQFKGFDSAPEKIVMQQILDNVAKFLPALSTVSISAVRPRTGFRPYMTGGKPVIGPVVELPGLFLASGHEGEGLTLALGTAEMVVHMVMDSKSPVDPGPYLPAGRLVKSNSFNMQSDYLLH